MAKVKKASLLNKSTESIDNSKTLHKIKKVSKDKQKKSLLSTGIKKIRRIYTDRKTGRKYVKYEGDYKGVVYIEHIPHGFYEEEIKNFFAQFGEVTAINLPRSKNGNGKGYAFIQFRHPDVAQIAADSMNNYLMFNRIIKTKYIPPEEQKAHLFRIAESAILKKRTAKDLAEIRRKQDVKKKGKIMGIKEENKFKSRTRRKLNLYKKRFDDLGLDFDCQIKGGAKALELISVKKLDESTESAEKTESSEKENEESVPAKSNKSKKKGKTPKPDKKSVDKTLIKANGKAVQAKAKAQKKTTKTPKPVQKPLIKESEETIPTKTKALKKTSKTSKPDKKPVQNFLVKASEKIIPTKAKTQIKPSKTPKPVQNFLGKTSGEVIPIKTKTLKKTSKTPKPVQNSLVKKSTEVVQNKMDMEILKAVTETTERMTRLKKSVESCLKKVDEVIPSALKEKIPALKKKINRGSALKKKINQDAKQVTKKRLGKKLVTQV